MAEIDLETMNGKSNQTGGFGGCAIALVQADQVERFKTAVATGYERATGRVPELYVSSAAKGAGRIF